MNREDYITFIDGGTSDGVGFAVAVDLALNKK